MLTAAVLIVAALIFIALAFIAIRQEKVMPLINDLKQAIESYRDDVKAKVAALTAKVDELIAHPAVPNDDAEVAALIAEVNAAKDDLDGVAAAPIAGPEPATDSTPAEEPPAEEPGTEPAPAEPSEPTEN